ncbi:polyhedrin [Dendrolimus punctatus cypovirus 22]|uniref:Polyhedrin n=1 Tax=Dendrolimus cypovirus XY-2009a TaxID=701071 RepID=D2KP51_9REOV|nr:polyhedrin [Dendrolimus punctatus cypovirus 22]ADA63849.1 polyhedrin [Dendrolimus cypovirus XY-2009a]AIY60608.1 polyhedrin [Dendrolimus punctatus cypovirus 22]
MSSNTYSRRTAYRDVRREHQEVVTHKLNTSCLIPDAPMRIIIILEYLSGRYRIMDYIVPKYLRLYLSWRELLEDNYSGHVDPDRSPHSLMNQSYRQLIHPNHGSGNQPYDNRYPVGIMISANGNVDWENLVADTPDMHGLTSTDWRDALNWSPNALRGDQYRYVDDISRFIYIPLDEHRTLTLSATIKSDGALNLWNGPQAAMTITDNIVRENTIYANTETDVVNYMQRAHAAYINQADVIVSKPKASMRGARRI